MILPANFAPREKEASASGGSTPTPVPDSTPTAGMPALCFSGTNVFVFYVVTTTTTNTVITAPIVAANGPIDYVGAGLSAVSPPSTLSGSGNGVTNNGVAAPGAAAGVSCGVAASGPGVTTKQLTCPGSVAGGAPAGRSASRGVIRLVCSLSRGRRTAHIAHRHTAWGAARTGTTKRKPARAHRRPAARNVYLCKRI